MQTFLVLFKITVVIALFVVIIAMNAASTKTFDSSPFIIDNSEEEKGELKKKKNLRNIILLILILCSPFLSYHAKEGVLQGMNYYEYVQKRRAFRKEFWANPQNTLRNSESKDIKKYLGFDTKTALTLQYISNEFLYFKLSFAALALTTITLIIYILWKT